MENKRNSPVKIKDGSIVQQEYDADGKPLRLIVIKSKKAEVYASYSLIKKDLDLVLNSLSELKKEHSAIVKQSLTFFAIINYAKCFVSNVGGRTILKSKALFKDAENIIKKTHAANIDLRMDYVAHAGSTFEKGAITATLYPLLESDGVIKELLGFRVNTNMAYMRSIKGDAITEFIELCNYVKTYVSNKLAALEVQLQEELYGLGDEELIRRSIIPIEEI